MMFYSKNHKLAHWLLIVYQALVLAVLFKCGKADTTLIVF